MLRRKVGKRLGVRDAEEFLEQQTELLWDDKKIEQTTNNPYTGRIIFSFQRSGKIPKEIYRDKKKKNQSKMEK